MTGHARFASFPAIDVRLFLVGLHYTVHAACDLPRLAVKLEPTNPSLLDAYAALLAEVEDPGALVALRHAVEAAPQSGHEKYMYLAQVG